MKKKINYQKIFTNFVFILFVGSLIFTAYRFSVAPVEITGDALVKTKSDYALMFLQCALGIVGMILPRFIEHRMELKIPSGMMLWYIIFLYCAIFLGEVRDFYYQIKHWDTILHIFSGGMLGALGFAFVSYLNETDVFPINLSPIFVAMFAFCFAVTLGVFWEIYEFTFDGLLGLNMQKFMLEDKTMLIGRAALADTMKDLIVDCLGAFVVTVFGYITLKHNIGWVESMQLIKKKVENKESKKVD